jgi:hypothetical protein
VNISTVSYFIIGIALASLAFGIIIMITVRVNHIPKWKTVCKVLIWVVGLLIFRLVFWGFIKLYSGKIPDSNLLAKFGLTNQTNNDWTFQWELPRGQYDHGANKSDLLEAEVKFRPDGSLRVNIYFDNNYKLDVCKMRLEKTGEKSWEGVWERDNPEDSGKCDLHEIAPGVMGGSMTSKTGLTAFCTLKKSN